MNNDDTVYLYRRPILIIRVKLYVIARNLELSLETQYRYDENKKREIQKWIDYINDKIKKIRKSYSNNKLILHKWVAEYTSVDNIIKIRDWLGSFTEKIETFMTSWTGRYYEWNELINQLPELKNKMNLLFTPNPNLDLITSRYCAECKEKPVSVMESESGLMFCSSKCGIKFYQ